MTSISKSTFLAALVASVLASRVADAFVVAPSLARPPSLLEAGRGMGMGTPTKNKKSKGVKKSGFSSAKAAASASKSVFNVSASLSRSGKIYDDLMLESAKGAQKEEQDVDDIVTTEYVIAARSSDPAAAVSDWVPFAQVVLARTLAQSETNASVGASDPTVRATVSVFCRELYHTAGLGSRVFQSIARQQLQYSVEPIDSFHKHVYEVLVEGKNDDASNEQVMTKKEARLVLGFDGDDMSLELSDIKKSYRTKSFQLHPDRFAGDEDETARDAALIEFSRVKLSYETLSSGLRRSKGDEKQSSWYASLGGRARNDFRPVELMSIKDAEETLEKAKVRSAVLGLDPVMVQGFVARGQTMVLN